MPRIEIIPTDWEGSKEQRQGDGTPTLDFCMDCADRFEEGELMDPNLYADAALVGCTNVDRPSYDDDTYVCADCGLPLSDEDD